METENVDMMEDGEVDESNEQVNFKRERKISESIRNSFSSLDEEKLKKRAERFGIDPDSTKVIPVTKEQMKDLYESLELPAEEIKNILESDMSGLGTHALNHRFEAIHLRGTEEMSTQNVFDYFKGYAPASIEWINDYSCNVVWLEPWQAARAMLERSSRNVTIQPTKNNIEGEAMDHEEAAEEEPVVSIPTPPGVWRLGLEYPLAKALVMRFATRADRKIKGAERLSHYYRNHGNPNYGGMAGLISSSRKRRFHGKPDPTEQVDSKNPWGSLAEEWGASEPAEWEAREPAENWEDRPEGKRPIGTGLPSALVRRLGHQPPRPSPSRSRDTESDASDEWNTTDSESGSCSSQSSNQEGRSRKKRPRMRMYADEEEERNRRKNLHSRLTEAHEEKNGQTGKPRTSRPVHTRLGPSVEVSPPTKSISTPSDLRQRLGSSVSKSPVDSVVLRGTLISADQEEGKIFENAKIDLRSKLQSRLGSK